MSPFGPEWSNLKQLKIQGSPGASFSLTTEPLFETTYNAELFYTKGPDYGIVDISFQDTKKGSFDGFGEQIYPGSVEKIEALKTQHEKLEFMFTISGKNSVSNGFNVGLDAIKLTPVRTYIPEWNLIGPFPNERESDLLRYGLDEPYPPEIEVVLDAEYIGADGQQVRWKKIQTPDGGYVSLWDKVDPYEFVVTYAVSYIYSSEEQTVPLLLGSDDGIKVFLNDETVHRFLDVRIAAPDQDTIPLNLRKGWNELLLKIENNFGGYAFYARVIDRKNSLRFVSSIARQNSGIRPRQD
jgi:hypothetical protein